MFQFVVPMGPPPSPGETARRGRGPIEYRVRLTHVASISTEYVYSPLPESTYAQSVSTRVLQRFLQGMQSHDNNVLTAITVRAV
jgi:hypothetical protein